MPNLVYMSTDDITELLWCWGWWPKIHLRAQYFGMRVGRHRYKYNCNLGENECIWKRKQDFKVLYEKCQIRVTERRSHQSHWESCLVKGLFEPGIKGWVGKIPWRRKWQPTPVFLPGKFHGWKSLVGYSPWGLKELDMPEWLHFLFFRRLTEACQSKCVMTERTLTHLKQDC